MARWVSHRTDNGSKALIAHAKTLGWGWLPHDGSCDGNLWRPDGRVVIVDFKSKGGLLTPRQQRLVMEKCPIEFVSTVEQLEQIMRHR